MQTCIVNCSVFVAIWPIFSIILQKKETNWCSYFEPIGSEEIYITWIALEHVAYLFRGFFFTEKHSDSMWVFFVIFWCCDHGVNFHSESMEYYLIMLLHCSMITWLFVLTLHILFSVTSLNDQIRINLLILFCWVFSLLSWWQFFSEQLSQFQCSQFSSQLWAHPTKFTAWTGTKASKAVQISKA